MASDWQERHDLKQLWENHQIRIWGRPLKTALDRFMRREVYPRHRKTGRLGRAWEELLPAELVEHSCLDGLRNGQLQVLVDSAAHLYELNLLVKQGLLNELRQECPSVAISRIKLTRGTWYHEDEEGNKIPDYK